MSRGRYSREVSVGCCALTVTAVILNTFTDNHVLALVLIILALGLLVGYYLGVK